jgi:uncharacterized membrane protein
MQATRSEALVRSANRSAFQPEPQLQAQPRRTTAVYTCLAALLLLWMLLFVILSRLFTQDYVMNAIVAVGSLVLVTATALYLRSRCSTHGINEAYEVPLERRARDMERARQMQSAQQAINRSRQRSADPFDSVIIRVIR